MELQGLLQIGESLILSLPLARHIDLMALGHDPIVLLADARCKIPVHEVSPLVRMAGLSWQSFSFNS